MRSRISLRELTSVPKRFSLVASRYPKNVALIYKDSEITYSELAERVACLTTVLQRKGVKKGDVVALKLERCLELYIYMLAILQAGGVIVTINTANPKYYVLNIMECARVSFFISENIDDYTGNGDWQAFTYQQLLIEAQHGPASADEFPSLTPDDPALMLMTSGSTGKPKSVLIRHSGLERLSLPVDQLQNSDKDRYLQLADVSFAASANEIWMSLLTGAALVIAPPGMPDLMVLEQHIRMHKVTILFLSGGLFRLFVEIAPDVLHLPTSVIVSGDFVTPRLFIQAACFGPAHIFNGLGCTENSAISSLYLVRPETELSDAMPVPVGTPLPLVQMVVLDEHQQRCTTGEAGELYIGGAGLASGYSDPVLTAQRFVTLNNPGANLCGRFYRTDDRACYDRDQNIVLLGRGNHICKIRGYRVDITGIEHVMRQHPELEDVLIVVEETSNEPRLHACYVSKQASLAETGLIDFLQHSLPGWMIPEKFTQLATLPVTPNGKKDRQQLKQILSQRV